MPDSRFARTGIEDDPAAAIEIELGESRRVADARRLETNRSVTVDNLLELFPEMPPGCWDRPPSQARLVPIVRQGAREADWCFHRRRSIRIANSTRSTENFSIWRSVRWRPALRMRRLTKTRRTRAESLAELDRAKTTFFSNVSHELRTPLTLILGPIEDALAAQEPPSLTTVEMLQRNTQRLLKLVNGLLDFVRIEAGRVRACYEATDLSLLTAHVASAFRSAIETSRHAADSRLLTVTRAGLSRP